jgi:hypothetical protein
MVNRAEHLVIVQWSTWPQAEPSFNAQPLEAALMYSAIARELRYPRSLPLSRRGACRLQRQVLQQDNGFGIHDLAIANGLQRPRQRPLQYFNVLTFRRQPAVADGHRPDIRR